MNNKPLHICDLILRDAHQSLLATRMRTDDMLPIAHKLDLSLAKVGRSFDSLREREALRAMIKRIRVASAYRTPAMINKLLNPMYCER